MEPKEFRSSVLIEINHPWQRIEEQSQVFQENCLLTVPLDVHLIACFRQNLLKKSVCSSYRPRYIIYRRWIIQLLHLKYLESRCSFVHFKSLFSEKQQFQDCMRCDCAICHKVKNCDKNKPIIKNLNIKYIFYCYWR